MRRSFICITLIMLLSLLLAGCGLFSEFVHYTDLDDEQLIGLINDTKQEVQRMESWAMWEDYSIAIAEIKSDGFIHSNIYCEKSSGQIYSSYDERISGRYKKRGILMVCDIIQITVMSFSTKNRVTTSMQP